MSELGTRELAVVEDLLAGWLPHQPWFAGSADDGVDVHVVSRTTLRDADPRVEHLLVSAQQGELVDVYQVPVSLRWEPEHRMEHVRIGQLRLDDHDLGWLYDALHDKDATAELLDHIAKSDRLGALSFDREDDVELPLGEPSTVLTHQHANTSLAYGDAALLKVFRRVHPGTNPDLEVHRVLSHRENTHVAPLYGSMSGSWEDPQTGEAREGTLAMLKRFLVTATDGWQHAEASVRDLFAEADLHPHEVGGDFAGEARRLGKAVAEVHADMRAALPTGTFGPADLQELAAGMQSRLDAAVPVVPGLGALAPAVGQTFAAVAELEGPVQAQRIHGDLTLDNVLRTVVGWKLIDFEGESAAPLDQRTWLDSPLRDVASMLRSLDYAAQRLRQADHPGDAQIAYRAVEWSQRNAEAFLVGWTEAFVGAGAEHVEEPLLLKAYQLDKAVAEASSEVVRRPTWVPIPLAGIARAVA